MEISHEDVQAKGLCSCDVEDDGDGESGPHLSIVAVDEECPHHGREARFQQMEAEWEEKTRRSNV